MKILFLGPGNSPLIDYLKSLHNKVVTIADKIGLEYIELIKPDFIISYGYRHIIKKNVIDRFPKKIINLHISYLPWNRGADPNFWSFLEHTPKGITIHYIDEGIDTGDIIAQRRIIFSSDETLKSSYAKLQQEIQKLFKEVWHDIYTGKRNGMKQSGQGTFHRLKDKEIHLHIITDGWDTPVSVVEKYGIILAKKDEQQKV